MTISSALCSELISLKKDASYEESVQLAQGNLRQDRQASITISRIATEKLKLNDWKRAEEIISSLEDPFWHDKMYDEIVKNRVEFDDLDHAIDCAREITKDFIKAEALGTIVRKFADCRDWKRAEALLVEIPEAEQANAIIYLILKLYDDSQESLALHFINKLEGEVKDYVLYEICLELLKRNKLIHTTSFVGQIQDERKRSHVLQLIAEYVLEKYQWDLALQFAEQIPVKKVRMDTQYLIVESLFMNGQRSGKYDALYFTFRVELQVNVWLRKGELKKALDVAHTIPDPERRSDALYKIGLRFIQIDETVVFRLINELVSQALARHLCEHYLSRGEEAKALKIPLNAPVIDRDSVLEQIAFFYAKAGDLKKAEEFHQQIQDVAKRMELEEDLFDAYYFSGNMVTEQGENHGI